MIFLLAFIVVESVVLFSGCGLAFNLAIDSHNLNLPLVVGCGVAGLALGLVFAWLVRRFFDKAPAVGWVWAYTFLSGWVIGGGVYYLTVAEADRPWVLIAMSCCLGTLPGLGMGWLLARIRPALWLKVPAPENTQAGQALFAAPLAVPTLAPGESGVPLLAPVGPGPVMGSALVVSPPSFYDPAVLQKRLKEETVQLEVAHPGSSSEVVPLAADRAAVIFNMVNYLGQLKFYIVCGADYPAEAPEEVFLEFVPAGQENAAPVSIDYEGAALDEWQPGYDLEAIVKDAALQVEESMIS